ncbi:MAG TPA: type II toxin-antitoxin system HicB family antitoxin [Longimicrobiales bacterium]|nr:type II toxin-antitoxin system HicB family antitoxin [Longimicrobiales bacterium]
MREYLIVVEPTETGFSAYSPDLPGCVSTGQTAAEVENRIREAVVFHVEGLVSEGQQIPEPKTYSTYITVSS